MRNIDEDGCALNVRIDAHRGASGGFRDQNLIFCEQCIDVCFPLLDRVPHFREISIVVVHLLDVATKRNVIDQALCYMRRASRNPEPP